jgi:predicted dehydrogenase
MVCPHTLKSNQQHPTDHRIVVVEKPFTTTSAEADALIATSKETGKILTVFQNRRYDSDFRTLQRVLSSGCLGAITEFQNNYDMDDPEWVRGWTSATPVPGEGMLYGLGTHSLDQTLLLFGQPSSVTAFTRSLRQKGAASDDTFTIVLQYEGDKSDLVCTVKTTIVSKLPMERQVKFVVRGRDGTFLKVSCHISNLQAPPTDATQNGEDPQIDQLFAGLKADDPAYGIEPETYHGELFTKDKADDSQTQTGNLWSGKYVSSQGSYLDYYKDVVAAIRGEKEVVVKPEESRMGIRVIELAKESAEKGVTVAWSES